ncbi:hypothetical protein RchiOBHm_Chr5g0042711 [Rosa chinensis]|uniref:Uncharacterized protein n=1 Tax=Rosa chinensis TaxID=74649 RepID=A0A2P6QD66_ROSCH|nr:hypothetical protein RchiOBHm_Chr6g0253711 [Rosa chinensis]PRQ32109.1 hypothetical protein RchiOBHm_Chr5g0042711 [Rosa chinensis]
MLTLPSLFDKKTQTKLCCGWSSSSHRPIFKSIKFSTSELGMEGVGDEISYHHYTKDLELGIL